jgi:RNA polymerase sigma-70 factor (ECF subfamily)
MRAVSTTVAVQQCLDALADAAAGSDSQVDPVVRELLARAANRLHLLCAGMLHRGYPRLSQGPVNLRSDEMLSAVIERLIKALRRVRPGERSSILQPCESTHSLGTQ